MSTVLTVDIGAGTMDVLYYDTRTTQAYKAVVRSPLQTVAERVEQLSGDLLVVGCEMGGGRVSGALKQHARNNRVIMSAAAAATINHDRQKVEAFGIEIVSTEEACELQKQGTFSVVELGDIEVQRLQAIIKQFGFSTMIDSVGICAQDHGAAPRGVSHLDFRQQLFKERLQKSSRPENLLYRAAEIPETLTRLRSIATAAKSFTGGDVFVMDSGMAAILGACQDERVRRKKNVLVVDIATSHTLGAAVADEELAGFFEYHTVAVNRPKLEDLLKKLSDGELTHKQVLSEGGHGAYVQSHFGFKNSEAMIITGPKRRLAAGSTLPFLWGAPFGDNMLTGAVGLLEAIRRRRGWDRIEYI